MPERFPKFFTLNQVIRLFPEMVLVEGAIVPAVRDDAVLGRGLARKVSRLSRTSDGGQNRFNRCL